jgi:hypothetical protein
MVASSSRPWYAGRCVSRHEHEKVVNMEVIARFGVTGWVALENVRHLFGGVEEVELRCGHAKSIKIGEWEMFQLSKKGKKLWIAGEHKKLHHYLDLSNLGGAAQIHRHLASDDLKTIESSGGWILRSQETEVLQVELRQAGGVAHLATGSAKIPAFSFDPDCIVRIPFEGKEVELYELRHKGEPAAIYDWSSDEEFAVRVIRAIASASDPRVKSAIAWLEEHGKTQQSLELLGTIDFAATNDALRSGKLAKRLANDQKLLAALVDSMLNDSRVADLIKSRTDVIAEDERTKLRIRSETKMQQELEKLRADRITAIEIETASLQLAAINETDARHAELEHALSERKKQGLLEISQVLGAKAAALQLEADELTSSCRALKAELLERSKDIEICTCNLESLREQEREARVNVDKLIAITGAAKSRSDTFPQRTLVPLPPMERGAPLLLSDVKDFVENSQLLSTPGKEIMLRFLVLLLAGEVPILCGPDVEDFLAVAEGMFANGASTRLACDPTVINFEDLWLRPGSNVETPLGAALAITAGNEGKDARTRLGVIAEAERSGARFWFPSLAARARRGELPRRLLVCVTIQDLAGEEAEILFRNSTRLEIREVLSPEAAIVAIGSEVELRRELDPGERPTDRTGAVSVLAPYLRRLSFLAAQRAAQAVIEARNIGTPTNSLVELFTVASSANTAVVAQIRS